MNNQNCREFDSKAFLTMVLSIVIIVGVIAVFSVSKPKKTVVKQIPQIRQELSDIVNEKP